MSVELQHIELNSMAEYSDALDCICASAQHDLFIYEKDFQYMGFNSAARHDILRTFLLSSPANRLHLLAIDPRPLTQYCPRVMTLLRQFSHNMHIRQAPLHLRHLSEPYAVADTHSYARRFHFDDLHGMRALHDEQGARVFKARFEEVWNAANTAVAPTQLGLNP
jgi:hypothetical protein